MDRYKTKVHDTKYAKTIQYDSVPIVVFTKREIHLDPGGYYGLQQAVVARRMNQASQEFSLGFDVYLTRGYFHVLYNGSHTQFHRLLTLERS